MASNNVAVPLKDEEVVFLRNRNSASEYTLANALQDLPLTEDTKCGYGLFQPEFLQRFATIKSFVVLYGIVGSIFSMTSSYFNGILTTVEKRFKIPSKNIGIIMVGLDFTSLFTSWLLSYYGGRQHRPRWLGYGLISIVLYCLLTSLPHFIYGPGKDALQLTKEYNHSRNVSIAGNDSSTVLCKDNDSPCDEKDGHLAPQVIFFLAQIVSGFGDSIYLMLGSSYMDDNAPKSEAPFLLSLSFFTRMLGPALGYSLASQCLELFVAPNLTPLITNEDPRWIGAWWLGWIVIALLLIIPSIAISCFPRELPSKAARRLLEKRKKLKSNDLSLAETEEPIQETSFHDMKKTFIRLCKNKVFMYTNLASILFITGFMPFWLFTPKYIEIQFRQSPSTASLVNGTMGIVSAALGVLISGAVISKYKPRTRYMAAWNTFVGVITAVGFVVYMFIGCQANDVGYSINFRDVNSDSTCSLECHCDYVPYTPVCGEDSETYISPCHAGCLAESVVDGLKTYTDCACIISRNSTNYRGSAKDGPCPVDCTQPFVIFVAVSCFMSFMGSTSRASNFLVSVRCVDEKDKSASLGFNNTMLCLFAFVPVPIMSGWIYDKFCLVWGKTCESNGNCWLYDSENLRFFLCTTAAVFITLGSFCDLMVWVHAKDVKCFDDEEEE